MVNHFFIKHIILLFFIFIGKNVLLSQNIWNTTTVPTVTNGNIGIGTFIPNSSLHIKTGITGIIIEKSSPLIPLFPPISLPYLDFKSISPFSTLPKSIFIVEENGFIGVNSKPKTFLDIRNENININSKTTIIGTNSSINNVMIPGVNYSINEPREIFFVNSLSKTFSNLPTLPIGIAGALPFSYNPISQDDDQGIFWTDGRDHVIGSGTYIPEGTNQIPEQFKNTSSGFVIAPYNDINLGIRITNKGELGVGTPMLNNVNNHKLGVNGSIICKELVVELNNAIWPDYVFEKNYNLISIDSLNTFIKFNKHLPGIPNAKLIKENNEIKVGEMQIKLLQKIEELTLYLIQLNNSNIILKEEIEFLKNSK